MSYFEKAWHVMSGTVHWNAQQHGFWDADRNDGEMLALIHSEISECLEALRHDNPESKKIPGFSQAEEELADAVIRIMDMGRGRDWQIAEAIVAKAKHNANRPHMHGKEF